MNILNKQNTKYFFWLKKNLILVTATTLTILLWGCKEQFNASSSDWSYSENIEMLTKEEEKKFESIYPKFYNRVVRRQLFKKVSLEFTSKEGMNYVCEFDDATDISNPFYFRIKNFDNQKEDVYYVRYSNSWKSMISLVKWWYKGHPTSMVQEENAFQKLNYAITMLEQKN